MATTTWGRGKHHHKEGSKDRGRNASSPGQIPAAGWKDTLMRVKEGVAQDRVSLVSAAMAFYALLAFVPALTALVLIYAWISDPGEITQHMAQFEEILPAEVQEIVTGQLSSLAGQANATLGFGAIFSLLLVLWSTSRANVVAMESLNVIYDERDQRGFIKRNALAIGLALLGIVLSLVAIGVIVVLPTVSAFLGLDGILQLGLTALGWVVLIGLFSFYLGVNYRFGPDRKNAQWKWVSRGSILASVLWVVASALFSWYVASFGNFNETYGSFGALVVLMFWFYITSFVILLGGELNAELEHQTQKDTTINDPNQPLGQRGAKMADTLGKTAQKE